MISLTQLQYIIAVDTYKHFATAASHCHITQPTLSMQIKKLEDDLGVKLFDRTKQPVRTTDVGEHIIAQAKVVLTESNKIESIVSQFTDTLTGELKLGIIPTLASTLLPLFIGDFVRKNPEISLKITELETAKLIEQLNRRELDIAIAVTPIENDNILHKPLFYEGIKAYVNPEHILNEFEIVPLEELSQPGLWLLSKGHCFRGQVLNLCSSRKENVGENPFEYTSGSLETVKKLVDVEGGFTLLPELFLDELPMEDQENIKKLKEPKPLREVSLIYTKQFAKQKLLDSISSHIKSFIPNKMLKAEGGNVVEWS